MKEHLRRMTLHITRYYPNHEDRVETAAYRRTRHQLIDVEKRGCWVCGTRENTETHHFYVEYADANAVDWIEFQKRHPNITNWSKLKDPKEFVDSPDNMLVLCAKHHRHINHGIHAMDYPSWELQAWDKSQFQFAPEGKK